MNKFLLSLLALGLFLTPSLKASDIPYSNESEARFFALEGQQLPYKAKAVARLVWDCGQVASVCAAGTYHTGIYLPKGSIVTNSYFYVMSGQAGGDITSTLSLQCEDTANLLPTTNFTSAIGAAGNVVGGAQFGFSTVPGRSVNTAVASTITAIAARCQIDWVVAGTTLTAGKVVGFVEYVLTQ